MTPDELLALADAGTPGPWGIYEYADGSLYVESDADQSRSYVLELRPNTGTKEADGRLVCLAPSLARDHAALLKWAERANAILGLLIAAPPDQAREIGALLAEFDVLRERP